MELNLIVDNRINGKLYDSKKQRLNLRRLAHYALKGAQIQLDNTDFNNTEARALLQRDLSRIRELLSLIE